MTEQGLGLRATHDRKCPTRQNWVAFSPALSWGSTDRHPPMKTAYELAMERLRAADPEAGAPLTAEQKARLAEIDRVYEAKIAEREIFLRRQLEDTQAAGAWDEAEKIRRQMTDERARLGEERDEEKEKVRRGSDPRPQA